MEKKIIHSEYEPDKRSLWLHTKNGNLVLEAFGNGGWESVGDDSKTSAVDNMKKESASKAQSKVPKAIKISLPELTDNCAKKTLIETVQKIKEALIEAHIIEL